MYVKLDFTMLSIKDTIELRVIYTGQCSIFKVDFYNGHESLYKIANKSLYFFNQVISFPIDTLELQRSNPNYFGINAIDGAGSICSDYRSFPQLYRILNRGTLYLDANNSV